MRRLVGVVFLLALLAPAPEAAAKNMHGKFGIGFERTLLGVQGLSASYWATPRLAIQLIGGVGFEVFDIVSAAGDENVSKTTLLSSAGFKWVVYATKFANLSVGGRFDLGWASRLAYRQLAAADGDGSSLQETVDDVIQWGLELPLEVEFFFSDAFSVNLGAGVVFTVVPTLPDDADPDAPGQVDPAILRQQGLGSVVEPAHTGVGVGVGSLFGHAGFTFYF